MSQTSLLNINHKNSSMQQIRYINDCDLRIYLLQRKTYRKTILYKQFFFKEFFNYKKELLIRKSKFIKSMVYIKN